eukprot:gb/GECG01000938.1/.p1 GENE.gb/GECG01000938.1/~~gb/GECG01000938.1/.p1  ORF type:complete len:267 (+),score=11.64 gb/GECG01000938.1/:1-801(+)
MRYLHHLRIFWTWKMDIRPTRSRLPHACRPCAQQKIKCDSGRPCSNCRRRGTTNECIDTIRGDRKKRQRLNQQPGEDATECSSLIDWMLDDKDLGDPRLANQQGNDRAFKRFICSDGLPKLEPGKMIRSYMLPSASPCWNPAAAHTARSMQPFEPLGFPQPYTEFLTGDSTSESTTLIFGLSFCGSQAECCIPPSNSLQLTLSEGRDLVVEPHVSMMNSNSGSFHSHEQLEILTESCTCDNHVIFPTDSEWSELGQHTSNPLEHVV